MKYHSIPVVGAWLLACRCVIGGVTPVLAPAPVEVVWSGSIELEPGSTAIIVGDSAADPEKEGARILQAYVLKRFGQEWPVLRENEASTAKVQVLIGQRGTSRRVADLCAKHAIDLSEATPGWDGYIIEVFCDAARTTVLIGGSNARGAAYGQDTLQQMLWEDKGKLKLATASVRDAPRIPWRGRPQTAVSHYLRPGEMDLYVSARINFIDLRGGIYAFEPGEELNASEILQAVDQAHRRGIFVFGTVNCGVPGGRHRDVLKTFEDILKLGADGVWLSFDDKGPGEDPVTLTKEVLKLYHGCRTNQRLVAITPPKGSYQQVDTEFNRKIMAVEGMSKGLWFWTGVPSTGAVEVAQSIGLKARPGWWHNWPRIFVTHAYTGLPPLSLGWHQAGYDTLANGGECLDAIMPWGGNSFGQDYITPTIGWWGWNPAKHDWNALRSRIYRTVFGPGEEAVAVQFDDKLQELFGCFRYSVKDSEDLPASPPRLIHDTKRSAAQKLLEDLGQLLEELERTAPAKTLVSQQELDSKYLEPMRREIEVHARTANLSFPEEWWPEHQRKILEAIYSGGRDELGLLMSKGAERVLAQVEAIGKALPSDPRVGRYVEWWRTRAQLDAGGWEKLLDGREKALKNRVREYGRQVVATGTMLEGLKTPPLEWGIGRWQVSNRVLATVEPSTSGYFWGGWLAGIHEMQGSSVAVFAADRRAPGEVGEYAELPVRVPFCGSGTNLSLLLYVSCANKDLFSNTMVRYRWAGYRYLVLLLGEEVLWEADLGRVPERGEWFMVRLPVLRKDMRELPLRLRVEDRKLSINNYTICFVGPVRLIETSE